MLGAKNIRGEIVHVIFMKVGVKIHTKQYSLLHISSVRHIIDIPKNLKFNA